MLEQIDPKQLEQFIPMITDYGLKVVGALVIFIAALFLSNRLRNLSMAGMKRAKIDETLVKFGGNAVKWSIMVIAIISVLGFFGVQTASFAAVIAAAGLAVGLAFQGTLSNFAAGVMLLVFRPFKVGQFIKVAGEAGTVDEISIFTTSIDTPDRRRIILPNASVFGATIENVSHHPIRRCDVAVGTAYDADLEKTRKTLEEVCKGVDGVLSDPAPVVVLTGLGASSIDWALRCHVKAEDYWAVHEKLLWDSKYALDKADIGIPFPQMDVYLNPGLSESGVGAGNSKDSAATIQ